MRIAIVDDYGDAFRRLGCAARLDAHSLSVLTEPSPALDPRRVEGAEVLLLTQQRTPITRSLLAALPKLRLISQTGRNTSHIDLGAATALGIAVSASGAGSPEATAELCWALILAAQRQLPLEVARLKAGGWQSTIGVGLHGKTLGVWGLGRIGGRVAAIGRAFGMNVLAFGRAASGARAEQEGHRVALEKRELFEQSDVLSLHLPLNAETRGLVSSRDLRQMKSSALLVNTSRAGLIEPGALVTALREGRPGRAAVDVFETEPVLGASDPLLALPNALCTPHLGYVEESTLERLYAAAVEDILAFAAGHPQNLLNPEALELRR